MAFWHVLSQKFPGSIELGLALQGRERRKFIAVAYSIKIHTHFP
jgi:hypothetical protein